MKLNQKTAAAIALTAACVTALGIADRVNAEDASGDSSLRLRERAGAVIEVGTKRAVAYYVKDANACQVNVIMSEAFADQIPFNIPSVRYSSSFPAGTSTQISTSDGATLALSCANGAKSLTVESRDSVAWAAATN